VKGGAWRIAHIAKKRSQLSDVPLFPYFVGELFFQQATMRVCSKIQITKKLTSKKTSTPRGHYVWKIFNFNKLEQLWRAKIFITL